MTTLSEQNPFNLALLRCAAGTDVGMRRDENQDSFGIVKHQNFYGYFIADGMGGVHGGATASRLAISTIEELLPTKGNAITPDALIEVAQAANAKIFEKGIDDPSLAGMGTTLVGLIFTEYGLVCLNVGDSRAYRVRGNSIQQLSEDHTLVRELLRSGAISPDEVENHPVSHMLTRSLGPVMDVQIEANIVPEQPELGDIYLLCSDGLYNLVRDQEMLGVVRKNPLDDANQILINLANQRGGADNITVLVISVGERIGKGRTHEYRKARDSAVASSSAELHAEMPDSLESAAQALASSEALSLSSIAIRAQLDQIPPPVQEPQDPRLRREQVIKSRAEIGKQKNRLPVILLVVMALVFGLTAGDIARRFGLGLGSFSLGSYTSSQVEPGGPTSLTQLSADLLIKREPGKVDLGLPDIIKQVREPSDTQLGLRPSVEGASAKTKLILERSVGNLEKQIKVLEGQGQAVDAAERAAALKRAEQLKQDLEQVQLKVEETSRRVSQWYGRRKRLDEPGQDDIFKAANQLKAAGAFSTASKSKLEEIEELSFGYSEKEGELELYPANEALRVEMNQMLEKRTQLMRGLLTDLSSSVEQVLAGIYAEFEGLKTQRDSLNLELQNAIQEVEIHNAILDPSPTRRNALRQKLEAQLADIRATLVGVEARL